MSQLVAACALITAMAGASFALTKLAVWLWRGLRTLFRLADALTGEPAAGGQPARPGFLDRLAAIEDHLSRMEDRLSRLDGFELRLSTVERLLAPAEIQVSGTELGPDVPKSKF